MSSFKTHPSLVNCDWVVGSAIEAVEVITKKTVSSKDLQMAKKHIKRNSVSLVIMEIQIKLTMTCHTGCMKSLQSYPTLCNPTDCSLIAE